MFGAAANAAGVIASTDAPVAAATASEKPRPIERVDGRRIDAIALTPASPPGHAAPALIA